MRTLYSISGSQQKVSKGDDSGLVIKGLRKSYRKRPILRDVSLELRRGEVIALLGPNGTGKTVRVAVFAQGENADKASSAGADIVGSDEFIEKIKSGELNFEKLICTPSMMVKLSKLGKVLGPKGLMPNPKLGTVSDDLKKAVLDAKSGQVEIKNDKDGNVGLSIGKKNFDDKKIIENFNALIQTIQKEKPNGIKGDFILSSFLTSSMGISHKIKLKV